MGSLPGKYSPLFSRHSAGGPYTVAGIDECPGGVWFVSSTATSAANTTTHGYTPSEPFATLAYAFSSDKVSADDTVYVMPGHTENVADVGGITMDIAGVRVVGLGRGGRRPTFTWSAADHTWAISAANCSVENVICTPGAGLDVTAGILVTAADCTIRDMAVRESAADSQFVDFLGFGAGAARGTVDGFRYTGLAAGDALQSGIQVTAAVSEITIKNARMIGSFAAGAIETTAANLNMLVSDVNIDQLLAAQDATVNLNAGTTGHVVRAYVRTATHDAAGFTGAFVGAAAQFYDCLVVNLAGEVGGAWGTASAAA